MLFNLPAVLFVVAVNTEVFPVRTVRRVVQVISVLVMNSEKVAVPVVKLSSAPGADESMNLKRAFPVIVFFKGGLL
jgi:hypothetical protein